MRLTTTTNVSVDGVMQGLGGADEDRLGSFERGGWVTPLVDTETGDHINKVYEGALGWSSELSKFGAGVRILVLSDSCHSGTVTRDRPPIPPPGTRARLMPAGVAMRVYEAHKAFYDRLQNDVAKAAGGQVTDPDAALSQVGTAGQASTVIGEFKPSVILMSGCQDNQVSLDGDHNGAFTEQLLQVWNHGAYRGTYAKFHAAIRSRLPATQSPNFFTLGPSATFVTQQPFSV